MKIDNTKQPESSFLSIEKDMQIITKKILENKRLQKLLLCQSSDAIYRPNSDFTPEMAIKMFGKNIKITPKMPVDKEALNYIFIQFDHFLSNQSNPQFRDNLISFDIVCHVDQWQLKDFQLRPYRIAAEIDSMFNDQKLSGIGTLEFMGAESIVLNDEFQGLAMFYKAIHGEEDKNSYFAAGNNAEQAEFEKLFHQRFDDEK